MINKDMGKNERYRRTFAMRTITEALTDFLDKRNAAERFHQVRLWEHWEMVMGPELASLGSPLGQRKDTLLIGAHDPMAAQELVMQAGEILERANAFMDRPCFTRVQVELMMGRGDLSLHKPRMQPAPPKYELPKPENLGGLSGTLDPASPVARCYEAYLQFFARRG